MSRLVFYPCPEEATTVTFPQPDESVDIVTLYIFIIQFNIIITQLRLGLSSRVKCSVFPNIIL